MSRTSISSDQFMVEPRVEYEGSQPVYNIIVSGATTVTDDSTLEMVVSKNGKDVTSDRTSGSMAVTTSSGDNPVITLKKLTGASGTGGVIGGERLFILVRGTVDGILRTIVTFWLDIKKESGK